MDYILSRRSIRKYTREPVADELVEYLLHAAMSAPSARNEQPWHFIVVRDHDTMDRVMEFHPFAQMLPEAQAAIIICADPSLNQSEYDQTPEDCSAAAENILLAAHSKGLGAVWLGIYPRPERMQGLRRLFGIPEAITPFAMIPLGYPAESKNPADRYKSERVHIERWQDHR